MLPIQQKGNEPANLDACLSEIKEHPGVQSGGRKYLLIIDSASKKWQWISTPKLASSIGVVQQFMVDNQETLSPKVMEMLKEYTRDPKVRTILYISNHALLSRLPHLLQKSINAVANYVVDKIWVRALNKDVRAANKEAKKNFEDAFKQALKGLYLQPSFEKLAALKNRRSVLAAIVNRHPEQALLVIKEELKEIEKEMEGLEENLHSIKSSIYEQFLAEREGEDKSIKESKAYLKEKYSGLSKSLRASFQHELDKGVPTAFQYREAIGQLKTRLHKPKERDTPNLQAEIKGMLVDPKLTAKEEHRLKDSSAKFVAPSQFYKDCDRLNKLTLNGETLSSIEEKKSPSAEEVSQILIKKFGQKAFERLGALMHQSLLADQVVDWRSNCWPKDWDEPDSLYNALSLGEARGYDFHLTLQGSSIEIDGQLILVIKNARDLDEHEHPKILGYVAIDRRLSLVKEELEQDLEQLSPNLQVPHLHVTQVVSDFCPTPEAALEDLKKKL